MCSTFNVGDRVYLSDNGVSGNDSGYATITKVYDDVREVLLDFEVGGAGGITYDVSRLTPAPEPERLVNTTELRIIWITLPGADRSYALSTEQASALLRQLEEVV